MGSVIAISGCTSKPMSHAPTTTSGTATSTTQPATSTSTTLSSAPTTTAASTTTAPTPEADYQPLFPFASLREATDWQQGYGREHQHWRFDAGRTAIEFAHFLGYSEIDRVVSASNDATGAHVAVGFATEDGQIGTAAIVHLIRFGAGENIPWEVVGTDDTTFTLETPKYGSTIRSPVSVGGYITGVDESISVQVQQLHANGPLGERLGIAAGGERSPWSTTVTFGSPTDSVLIVSASTGGHLRKVERFAVTGVKSA